MMRPTKLQSKMKTKLESDQVHFKRKKNTELTGEEFKKLDSSISFCKGDNYENKR